MVDMGIEELSHFVRSCHEAAWTRDVHFPTVFRAPPEHCAEDASNKATAVSLVVERKPLCDVPLLLHSHDMRLLLFKEQALAAILLQAAMAQADVASKEALLGVRCLTQQARMREDGLGSATIPTP